MIRFVSLFDSPATHLPPLAVREGSVQLLNEIMQRNRIEEQTSVSESVTVRPAAHYQAVRACACIYIANVLSGQGISHICL